jgi:thiosulfate/3-mercaptopyruvate sulfurtransferase
VITFCNTGHWASLGWFVQSEILGRADVKLYDGSVADWALAGGPLEAGTGEP